MGNVIIIGIVAVLAVAAVRAIVKAKKQGAGCIGCPTSDVCHGDCGNEKNKPI